jgi:hypothetical protein
LLLARADGIFRSIRRMSSLMKWFGALPICAAFNGLLGAGFHLLFGVLSLWSFLKY